MRMWPGKIVNVLLKPTNMRNLELAVYNFKQFNWTRNPTLLYIVKKGGFAAIEHAIREVSLTHIYFIHLELYSTANLSIHFNASYVQFLNVGTLYDTLHTIDEKCHFWTV